MRTPLTIKQLLAKTICPKCTNAVGQPTKAENEKNAALVGFKCRSCAEPLIINVPLQRVYWRENGLQKWKSI